MASPNYLEILYQINESLKESGFGRQADELNSEIKYSFTSTEICMKCGSILLAFKNELKLTDKTSNLINEFAQYCRSIGLLINHQ